LRLNDWSWGTVTLRGLVIGRASFLGKECTPVGVSWARFAAPDRDLAAGRPPGRPPRHLYSF
jgi:hypothetical protein